MGFGTITEKRHNSSKISIRKSVNFNKRDDDNECVSHMRAN